MRCECESEQKAEGRSGWHLNVGHEARLGVVVHGVYGPRLVHLTSVDNSGLVSGFAFDGVHLDVDLFGVISTLATRDGVLAVDGGVNSANKENQYRQ